MTLPRIPIPCIPHRYLVSIECFIALTISYIMRFVISMALTEMTKLTKGGGTEVKVCNFGDEPKANTTVEKTYEFEWSPSEIGLTQSLFFVGYCISLLPSGVLSDMIGAQLLITFGLLITGTCTVLTPFAARMVGVYGVIFLRLFIGLSQGMLYAALHTVLAVWIPKAERATWGTIIFAGVYTGNAINFGVSGLFLSMVKGGWPYLFYMFGGFGIFWAIFFFFTTYNVPEDHPNMSEKEKNILAAYKATVAKRVGRKTPWVDLFLNNPVWCIMIAMFGHGWGLFLLMTSIPTFMKAVLNMDIKSNGLFNALTNISIWALGIGSGFACDYITKKKWISPTVNRKIGTTLASVFPSLGFVLSCYTNCSRTLAVFFLTSGMAFMGFFYPSLKVNPIDVAPNFSATIGALGHVAGSVAGVTVSYLTPVMTKEQTLSEWRTAMWIGFVVMSVCNIYYVCFASAEIQSFNCGLSKAELNILEQEGKKGDKLGEEKKEVSKSGEEKKDGLVTIRL